MYPHLVDARWRRLSPWQIRLTKAMVLLGDVLSALTVAALAAMGAAQLTGLSHADWLLTQDLTRYWAWLATLGVGVLFFLVRFKHYSDRKPFWTELGEIWRTVLVLAVLDLALTALLRWNASRLWWALVWAGVAIAIPLARTALRGLMRRFRLWQRPTVIVGGGVNADEAAAALSSEPALGFEVVAQLGGHANLQLLRDWAKVPGVQFVVAVEHGQNEWREEVLRQLARQRAEDVSVIPAMRGVPLFGTDIAYFFSHEVAMLKLRNNLRYWPARLLKRAFDLVAALLLLGVMAVPLAAIAWRIRRDGGPAIFAHQRVGQTGKTFPCYKFRTMAVDAEQQLRDLLATDPAARAEWEREFKLRDDPRITAVGHFLRRTSLDELPQLWNVIRGEMSLVGPRPIVASELPRYGDDVDYFLMVRPGITGLWQVSGRSNLDYPTRVYLDTWYVKNWSLWYDIAILFKTVAVVFKQRGAY
jgi:Undecaprenyl-phosphate galactose phosphotransferase WbaP